MTLVIGIGNRQRGDDAAGLLAAAAVRQGLGPHANGIEVIEHEGDMSQLVDWLEQVDRVYLIDAAASGAAAGTVHRLDAQADVMPGSFYNVSSHGFGLAEAVELARVMGTLPVTCVIYAVEGESFEPGAAVSAVVTGAVREIVERLLEEVTAPLPEDVHA